MVECNNHNLTEDEAALYDRQIRLWGLDAQKRLGAATVLVAGACGVGAEVIKNLVLAGVKSLTILDHRKVSALDTYSNFLAPHDSIGKNIAEASIQRAQNLNPMVAVTADDSNIADKDEEFFKQFSVVCLCRCSKDQLLHINNICHQNEILFYAGDVFGLHGYMFADLHEHTYIEEMKEKVETEINGKKEITEETKMVKRVESFVPLSVALEVDWASQRYAIRLKRTSANVFIMHILHEFEFLYQRRPDPANRQEDEIQLLTIKNSLLDKMGIPQQKVNNDFAQNVYGQVSPVCAIVGGVLAQETIKAVSQKDVPHNNFFFFNPQDCGGVVECIGY